MDRISGRKIMGFMFYDNGYALICYDEQGKKYHIKLEEILQMMNHFEFTLEQKPRNLYLKLDKEILWALTDEAKEKQNHLRWIYSKIRSLWIKAEKEEFIEFKEFIERTKEEGTFL